MGYVLVFVFSLITHLGIGDDYLLHDSLYVNCLHARFALFGLLVVAALIMSLLYMNSLFAMRFCIVLM